MRPHLAAVVSQLRRSPGKPGRRRTTWWMVHRASMVAVAAGGQVGGVGQPQVVQMIADLLVAT